MKKRLIKLAIMVVVIFGVHSAASSAMAQTDVIVGGYGEKSVSDKDVVKAAGFAIKKEASKTGKRLKLVKIEKAETQVVAGVNYRVCMTVKVGRKHPAEESVTAVVYTDLRGRMSLSKWQDGGCQEL